MALVAFHCAAQLGDPHAALQRSRLDAIRRQLLGQRDGCLLFDTPRFTRTLEAAYEAMHRLAVGGEAPRDITIAG